MGFWQDITGQTGADAAREASALQYQREQAATAEQKAGGTQAQADYGSLAQPFQTQYGGYATGAFDQLMRGLGLSGDPNGFAQAYQSTPGYTAGKQAGEQSALRGAAASGHGLDSGGTLKALYRFGQGYDQDAYNKYIGQLMGVGQLGMQGQQFGAGLAGRGIDQNLGAQASAYGKQFQSAATEPLGQIAAANSLAAGSNNLLKTGVSLAGTAMGGGFGGSLGSSLTNLWNGNPAAAGTVGNNYAGPVNPYR